MKIDTGIPEGDRKSIAEGLGNVLADTYTLYLKTHNYHWNVTGPMFQTLHLLFETHYNELWMATDVIAERIRALGSPAPGTYEQFSKLTSVKSDEGIPEAMKMIRNLVEGHETVIRTARALLPKADDVNDQVTADLLAQRMEVHEKTAWMLRSMLE